MILQIAKKEFKEIVREARFKTALITIVLLGLISLWTSLEYYKEVKQAYEESTVADRSAWEGQVDKNPHSAAHYGMFVFKPKSPFSLFDPGVDKYTGVSIYLEAHRRNVSQYSDIQDQSALARFGDLTPGFVFIYLIPLIIIFIGFNAFSREREMGTLKLVVSQGITYFQLCTGKWLALFLIVSAFTIPLFGACFVLLGQVGFGAFSPRAFLYIMMMYMAYFMVFINVTLFISSFSKQSSRSLVLALGFWIFAALLIPKAVSSLAERLYPLPSQEQIAVQIRQELKTRKIGNIHDLEGEAYQTLLKKTLDKYGVKDISGLPVNMSGIRLTEGETLDTKLHHEQFLRLKQTMDQQERLFSGSMLLSPVVNARFLSMGLSGTGNDFHWRFSDAADSYRYTFVQFLNGLITNAGIQERYTSFKSGAEDWKSTPRFTYELPSFSDTLKSQAYNFYRLLGWLILSSVLLMYSSKNVTP